MLSVLWLFILFFVNHNNFNEYQKYDGRFWYNSLQFLLNFEELYGVWRHVWCMAINCQPFLMSCFYTECFVYMPPCNLENTLTDQPSRNRQARGLRPTQQNLKAPWGHHWRLHCVKASLITAPKIVISFLISLVDNIYRKKPFFVLLFRKNNSRQSICSSNCITKATVAEVGLRSRDGFR